MTEAAAARAAANLVSQLKRANEQAKDGPKVSSAKYAALQRKLEKHLQSL
jgi:hypothetical protein